MPFLITSSHTPEHDGATGYIVSRRAVATLEEARHVVYEAYPPPWSEPADLWTSGGTVSLPDGTTIAVEFRDWSGITHDLDMEPWHLVTPPRRAGALIAAWNAAQS